METKTIDKLLADARMRGIVRATYDRSDGTYNPQPLSGEWAGESMMEILGDLIDSWDGVSDSDMEIGKDAILDDACDAYESGYDSVFDIDDSSRAIRDAVILDVILLG